MRQKLSYICLVTTIFFGGFIFVDDILRPIHTDSSSSHVYDVVDEQVDTSSEDSLDYRPFLVDFVSDMHFLEKKLDQEIYGIYETYVVPSSEDVYLAEEKTPDVDLTSAPEETSSLEIEQSSTTETIDPLEKKQEDTHDIVPVFEEIQEIPESSSAVDEVIPLDTEISVPQELKDPAQENTPFISNEITLEVNDALPEQQLSDMTYSQEDIDPIQEDAVVEAEEIEVTPVNEEIEISEEESQDKIDDQDISLIQVETTEPEIDLTSAPEEDTRNDTQKYTLTELRSLLLQKTNAQRSIAISQNWALNQVAQNYANYICTTGNLSHTGPSGERVNDRIKANGNYPNLDFYGENLAQGYRYVDDVIAGWLASSTHAQALRGSQYRHVGFGNCESYWVMVLASQK